MRMISDDLQSVTMTFTRWLYNREYVLAWQHILACIYLCGLLGLAVFCGYFCGAGLADRGADVKLVHKFNPSFRTGLLFAGRAALYSQYCARWVLKDFDATLGYPGEGPAARGGPYVRGGVLDDLPSTANWRRTDAQPSSLGASTGVDSLPSQSSSSAAPPALDSLSSQLQNVSLTQSASTGNAIS